MPSRNRNRTTGSHAAQRAYWVRRTKTKSTGVTTTSEISMQTANADLRNTESMSDIYSENGRADHPCTHTKRYAAGIAVKAGGSHTWSDNYFEYTNTPKCDTGLFINFGPPSAISFSTPSDSEYAGLLEMHYQKINASLAESVSIANFALELGDLKRLFRSLGKRAKDLKSRKVGGLDPSSGLLDWTYGVLPLLSDLRGIYESLERYNKQLAMLRRTMEGRSIRITTVGTITREGVEPESYQPPDASNLSENSSTSWGYSISPYLRPTCEVKFVSEVAYDTSSLGSFIAPLLSALKTVGLSNPAKVAWNATRLSFVVDWVFNVSGYLDRFDLVSGLFIYPRIIRSTTHFTHRRERFIYISCKCRVGPPGAWSYTTPWNGEKCGVARNEHYVRVVGIPPRPGLQISLPSLRELVLATALLDQNNKNSSWNPRNYRGFSKLFSFGTLK